MYWWLRGEIWLYHHSWSRCSLAQLVPLDALVPSLTDPAGLSPSLSCWSVAKLDLHLAGHFIFWSSTNIPYWSSAQLVPVVVGPADSAGPCPACLRSLCIRLLVSWQASPKSRSAGSHLYEKASRIIIEQIIISNFIIILQALPAWWHLAASQVFFKVPTVEQVERDCVTRFFTSGFSWRDLTQSPQNCLLLYSIYLGEFEAMFETAFTVQ